MRFSRSSLIAASAFILLLPVDARIANPLNLFRSKRGQPEQNHKRVESVVCVDHDIYSDFLKNISEANQFCVAHLRIPPATVETTYTPVITTTVVTAFRVRTVTSRSRQTATVTATATSTIFAARKKRAPEPTPAASLEEAASLEDFYYAVLEKRDTTGEIPDGGANSLAFSFSSACECYEPTPILTKTVTYTAAPTYFTQFGHELSTTIFDTTEVIIITTTVTLNTTIRATSTGSSLPVAAQTIISSVVSSSVQVFNTPNGVTSISNAVPSISAASTAAASGTPSTPPVEGFPINCLADNNKTESVIYNQVRYDYLIVCGAEAANSSALGAIPARSAEECLSACTKANNGLSNIECHGITFYLDPVVGGSCYLLTENRSYNNASNAITAVLTGVSTNGNSSVYHLDSSGNIVTGTRAASAATSSVVSSIVSEGSALITPPPKVTYTNGSYVWSTVIYATFTASNGQVVVYSSWGYASGTTWYAVSGYTWTSIYSAVTTIFSEFFGSAAGSGGGANGGGDRSGNQVTGITTIRDGSTIVYGNDTAVLVSSGTIASIPQLVSAEITSLSSWRTVVSGATALSTGGEGIISGVVPDQTLQPVPTVISEVSVFSTIYNGATRISMGGEGASTLISTGGEGSSNITAASGSQVTVISNGTAIAGVSSQFTSGYTAISTGGSGNETGPAPSSVIVVISEATTIIQQTANVTGGSAVISTGGAGSTLLNGVETSSLPSPNITIIENGSTIISVSGFSTGGVVDVSTGGISSKGLVVSSATPTSVVSADTRVFSNGTISTGATAFSTGGIASLATGSEGIRNISVTVISYSTSIVGVLSTIETGVGSVSGEGEGNFTILATPGPDVSGGISSIRGNFSLSTGGEGSSGFPIPTLTPDANSSSARTFTTSSAPRTGFQEASSTEGVASMNTGGSHFTSFGGDTASSITVPTGSVNYTVPPTGGVISGPPTPVISYSNVGGFNYTSIGSEGSSVILGTGPITIPPMASYSSLGGSNYTSSGSEDVISFSPTPSENGTTRSFPRESDSRVGSQITEIESDLETLTSSSNVASYAPTAPITDAPVASNSIPPSSFNITSWAPTAPITDIPDASSGIPLPWSNFTQPLLSSSGPPFPPFSYPFTLPPSLTPTPWPKSNQSSIGTGIHSSSTTRRFTSGDREGFQTESAISTMNISSIGTGTAWSTGTANYTMPVVTGNTPSITIPTTSNSTIFAPTGDSTYSGPSMSIPFESSNSTFPAPTGEIASSTIPTASYNIAIPPTGGIPSLTLVPPTYNISFSAPTRETRSLTIPTPSSNITFPAPTGETPLTFVTPSYNITLPGPTGETPSLTIPIPSYNETFPVPTGETPSLTISTPSSNITLPAPTGSPSGSLCPCILSTPTVTVTAIQTIYAPCPSCISPDLPAPESGLTTGAVPPQITSSPLPPAISPIAVPTERRRSGEPATPAQIAAACTNRTTNAVWNGGFEIVNADGDPVGWTASTTSSAIFFTTLRTGPYAGVFAGRVVSTLPGATITVIQALTLCPGTGYVLSAVARQERVLSECTVDFAVGGRGVMSVQPTTGWGARSEGFTVGTDDPVTVDIEAVVSCVGRPAAGGTLVVDFDEIMVVATT